MERYFHNRCARRPPFRNNYHIISFKCGTNATDKRTIGYGYDNPVKPENQLLNLLIEDIVEGIVVAVCGVVEAVVVTCDRIRLTLFKRHD